MVKFKTHKKWPATQVAIRLARILRDEGSTAENDPPWENQDGFWQLDRDNNWFLLALVENEYQLTRRYFPQENSKMLQGLGPFLEHVFR